MTRPKQKSSVKTLTLGCRLNLQESDVMQAHAQAAGLGETVIVNTCAVTNEASRRSRQTIRRAHRENPDATLIVTGCAAQIDTQKYKDLDGVDRVVGNAEKLHLTTFTAIKARTKDDLMSDIMATRQTGLPNMPVVKSQKRSRAIVQVQNGCNHRCTFCIIPYGRGNSRSLSIEQIVAQVRGFVENGILEVVLSGVDISSWGEDLPNTPKLGHLVGAVLDAVPQLPRLRLSSIDPAEVDDELLDIIAHEPRFMPYLHLSLQHGDDLILKRMKRRHLRKHAVELCSHLRNIRPDIRFGADLIAGFPTESKPAFENSRSLIQDCDLTWLHIFPYSPKRGTPAARMPALGGPTIKSRAAILRQDADAARLRHLKSRTGGGGQYDLALIERGTKSQGGIGRLADFTPIDLGNHKLVPGTLHPVRICDYTNENLLGELA